MNFFNDTTAVDTHISSTFYNDLITQNEGIDLRQEMNWLLYGKQSPPARLAKGHWVIYRRFDRTQKSEYYSERTHEGVGGPAYVYTDELLRTRRVPLDRKGDPIDPLKAGSDIGDKYAYYLEYTVVPKRGDQIYEISWPDHAVTPTDIPILTYTDRYTIMRTHDYRLENGNIQYYILSTEFDEVRY